MYCVTLYQGTTLTSLSIRFSDIWGEFLCADRSYIFNIGTICFTMITNGVAGHVAPRKRISAGSTIIPD